MTLTKGYVKFASEDVFNAEHEESKEEAGYPIVGMRNGKPDPDGALTTEMTSCTRHPEDGTVVAYIDENWADRLKVGKTYYLIIHPTITPYFPEREL